MNDAEEIFALKTALVRGIIFGTEAAGLMDQPRFLRAIGMNENWLRGAIHRGETVPLENYIAVYNSAAEQAGWQSLSAIVKRAVELQRFHEWAGE